jgi:hypothetical protein
MIAITAEITHCQPSALDLEKQVVESFNVKADVWPSKNRYASELYVVEIMGPADLVKAVFRGKKILLIRGVFDFKTTEAISPHSIVRIGVTLIGPLCSTEAEIID